MGLRIEICLLFISTLFLVATAQTNTQDFAALEALKDAWTNIPPNWGGPDPCGSSWVGIHCNNSRITSIILPSMGLIGQLTGDIGQLTELQMLALESCGFYGPIPGTIGYMQQLRFLYLSSNSFSESIPSSIGNLSNLYWLDLSVNNLSGPIPVSSGTTPGLDMLVNTKHFHFGNNQLSGAIPASLFNSSMTLIHVLFESNQFNGSIPSTLALVLSLEVVRLDRNSLTGSVPSNFSNLVNVNVLYLSNNQLTGPLPNLSGMNDLYNVDLSNNTFDASLFPSWFSNLLNLTTIAMENTRLNGSLPGALFNLSWLQTVSLSNNQLNGILDVGSSYGNQLKLVDLQNNSISYFNFTERVGTSVEFILVGNPACSGTGGTHTYCAIPPSNPSYSFPSYSFPPINCIPPKCRSNEVSSPNCRCAYPYTGTLIFKAPSFSDLGNSTNYTALGSSLLSCYQSNQLPVDSLYLSNSTENTDSYLLISLELFPYGQDRFNQTGMTGIAFVLRNQTFKPPNTYGPFNFRADPYNYFAGNNSSNRGVITGAAVGGSVVLLLALLAGFYAFRQKRRAERADRVNNPFASWNPNTTSGGVPLLQGATCFSYDKLKKYTNNFAEANRIGSGGYGKVYRGTLSNGQLVAIKRAQQGSLQGGLEFKMEIELLSRIHHKNVVGLMGFCFERAEQMLVYEYIANGTLHESLSGKTGINLDWMRRLRIALGVARGLQYLHELADPPIIHRDIKSSNILLDERLNAKVSDFGLSKPMGDAEKSHISTQVKGTMGYMDPEYYMTQQLTEKSDVYSFGVVLLELVTARQPIEKGKYIVREVRQRMKRDQLLYSLDEILDPVILAPTPNGLEQLVDLAMRCVEEEGARRPTMGAVVKEIENVMQIAGLNPNVDSSSSSATHEGDAEAQILLVSKDAGSFELIAGRKPIECRKNIVWEVKEAMDNASDPSELLEILNPATGCGTSLVCNAPSKAEEGNRQIMGFKRKASASFKPIFLLSISIQFLVATAQTNPQDQQSKKQYLEPVTKVSSSKVKSEERATSKKDVTFILVFPAIIGFSCAMHLFFAALKNLKEAWTNIALNWDGLDPCGSSWVGIQCNNSRITAIILPSMGLIGQLPGDIGQLLELQMLDLSYNNGLTGPLTPIGSLTKLTYLALVSCSFSGPIPDMIGSLQQLFYLDLNSNNFSGSIPPSIGNLSNLYVLDLTNNSLSGTIPVSSGTAPGLDKLLNTKHFHFGNNQLSGAIPSSLFSSSMTLIHVLFQNNQFNGSIPSTLALVQKLEVVRLDGNSLTGSVPSQFSNLTSVSVLYLSNNRLSGPIPNLSTMKYLNYVDLSNNTFDASVFPSWLSNLQSLTTIVMENTKLYGPIPGALFNLPQLQTASLSNNQLNGILDVPSSYGNQLELVDLQKNSISAINFTKREDTTVDFILVGNPACTGTGRTKTYCVIPPSNSSSYSTPPNNCIRHRCSSNKVSSPNCICAYPYTGTLIFRAPSFSNLRNNSIYTSLEKSLMTCFNNAEFPVDSVSISNPSKNTDNYLLISIEVFPYGQERFNRTEISRIAFALNSKNFTPPITYGTFSFQANPYNYFAGNNSSNRGVITGAAVGGSVVLLLALLAGFYAFRQKRRAERADRVNNPFASWNPNTTSGGVPLLQGATCFSYDELKKYTNNFAEANRIGSGGYGKVYRGTLSNGQLVAIKRAQQGSLQGGLEFKMEIELLSRIHHKNVVGLMGFCFERAEQMLVYEYIANGTLHESLSEYYMTQQLTEKSDVYSFGVVLLELVTARHPIEKGKYIVREVRQRMKRDQVLYSLDEILDPVILAPTPKGLEQLVDLAMRCVEEEGARRPAMGAVVKEIENVMQIAGLNPNADSSSTSATHEGDAEAQILLVSKDAGSIAGRKPIERRKNIVWEVKEVMDNASDPFELLEILNPATGCGTSLVCLKKFVDLAMSCVGEISRNRPKIGEVVREIENIIQEVAALGALKDAWTNIPNWDGHDPCGSSWVGIQCNNSRITAIILPSMGLIGHLTGDIGQLSELQMLYLVGCGFNGLIPDIIGSLKQLLALDLNSNSFSGSIPPSIGDLSNLYVLDLTNNSLSGTIPVSSGTTPGLDKLLNTRHFHFGNNQLSGAIPSSLFSSSMTLIHVLFENNQFNGSIPSTLALVQKLEVVRLDGNSLSGSVPSQFSNLTSVNVLYLSNNQLSGPFPNLSTMKYLNYVDLSNNTFDASVFPSWLSNLQSLTTIVMENTGLYGSLLGALFNLPQLQTVSLSNNKLNGNLDVGSSYGNQLKHVDLQNNLISDFNFTKRVGTTVEFILVGNPACTETQLSNSSSYCVIPSSNSSSYSTPPNNCVRPNCSSNEVSSPNCRCAYPYTGILIFRAPSFSDLGNSTIYTTLESSLMACFRSNQLPVDSVSLSSPTKTTDNDLLISLEVFPYDQERFNRTGISGIAFVFSSKNFNPPSTYGTFSFHANHYNYLAEGNNSSNRGVITGAAVGGSVVLLLALLAGFYAFRQKRRAEKADRVNNPFASWDPNTTSGGVPLLKEASCFSYDELKKYTNNFAEANRIGSGGYGKVYRGTLPNGQLVAIKRAQRGSVQGGLEFKTEIELLSRGYMDPEYYMTQQLTEKSDVYSFGVVLLELVTARQPIEKGKYIVREVRERMKRDQVLYSLDEILDPAILAPTSKGLEQFVDLAMRCVEEEGARRPVMGVVVKEIEIVMQIAGLNPNADSTSTSATHEADGKGNHPYTDDSSSVYSGTFSLASN
ncbi:hypothetical protein RHSIM_Rhsim11G0113500 [Rhododendron simsii]|uniref:non-specific serine/threonine protein kinase n=1 Tax=Rhododendron simsii TaxID=118357 RepID=A0A834GC41_RHOSS|nr:hypothetical protein RHSIM_Rhsim11G0113500 [Rhododendron simsii]